MEGPFYVTYGILGSQEARRGTVLSSDVTRSLQGESVKPLFLMEKNNFYHIL